MIVFFFCVIQNCRSDPLIRKYLKKQAVRNPSVQDMHPGYAVLNGVHAILKLRQHTAFDITFLHQCPSIRDTKLGDQSVRIGRILVHAFDIRQKRKLLRIHSPCDRTRGIIRIDIICMKILIHSYWTYNREEIFLQQVKQNIRIDLPNLSYESDIRPVRVLLLYLEQRAVLAADPDRADA